jgi:ABC transporter with metal-binding/Fe-S-binding domain ATP-binding protein
MVRLLALYSGGKDSTLAVEKALRAGHEVACLVTVRPRKLDSWMFHSVCLSATPLQAEAMGAPHVFIDVGGEKELELAELAQSIKEVIDNYRVEGILSGAITSNYQKKRIDTICSKYSLRHLSPNWGMSGRMILEEVVNRGYEVLITSVSAYGLGREWLGRVIDREAVNELVKASSIYGFNPGGEGGEYETLVLDCPIFTKRLVITGYEVVWRESSGYIQPTSLRLAPKS